MKNSIIFLKTTQKLYDQVNAKKEKSELKGNPYFTHLNIELNKTDFEEEEWNFLIESEKKFNTTVTMNGEIESYPVYKIENEKLLTNELNVKLIGTKYTE